MKRGIAFGLTLAFAASLAQAQSISGGGGGSGGGGITFSGSVTNGNCPQIASSSQLSDSGAPCGGGLSSIANGNVLSNITGSSYTPSGNTLTATIDASIGSTSNDFLYRGASVWSLGSFGTGLSFSGGVLSAAVTSVAGRTGAVTLSSGDISGLGAFATQSTPCTIAQGCTGTTSLTAHGVLVGEGTSAATATAAGAANTVLVGNGASVDPSFATLSAEIDAAIGSTRGSILERGASGWALVTPGTSGTVLTSNGASADPSYQAGGGGAVASVSGTSGQVSCSPTTGSVVCGLPGTITQATTFSGGLTSSGLTTESAGVVQEVTVVTSGTTYTALSGDRFICVKQGTPAALTLTLIASPATGRTYTIKDCAGVAAADNITVTPAAGNIDGGASYVMATNHQAINVVYDGTQWEVY